MAEGSAMPGSTTPVVCHDKWHLLYTLFGTVRSSPRHTTGPVTSKQCALREILESDVCSNKMPFSVVRRCQIIWQFTTKSRKSLSWASLPDLGRGRRAWALRCAPNGR